MPTRTLMIDPSVVGIRPSHSTGGPGVRSKVEGPGFGCRTAANTTVSVPSRRKTPELASTAIHNHSSAGAVAPTSACTLTLLLPSGAITTSVQLPFSIGQMIVCSPGPAAWARQILSSVGAVDGAAP